MDGLTWMGNWDTEGNGSVWEYEGKHRRLLNSRSEKESASRDKLLLAKLGIGTALYNT